MGENTTAICRECKGKLTIYEINDNIYAGSTEREYICYKCQSNDDIEEDTDYDDIDSNFDFDI